MEASYPGTEVYHPAGELGETLAAELYVPTPVPDHRLEVSVDRDGAALGLEGGGTMEVLAGFLAWLARTAPVPGDGSVVLIEWADDVVPLTPDLTAEGLLGMRS